MNEICLSHCPKCEYMNVSLYKRLDGTYFMYCKECGHIYLVETEYAEYE